MHQADSNDRKVPTQPADVPPSVGGVHLGPGVASVLYVLLLGAATLALAGRSLEGEVGRSLVRVAPWVFLAFLVCFAAYRLVLVRARKYPAFKAYFQLAVGGAVFALMLPAPAGLERGNDAVARGQEPVLRLLRHEDPHVRALASEVLGFRGDPRYGRELVARLADRSPEVRSKAHAALVKISGADLGPPDDEGAIKAWRERYP